jgi:hypothetical protein
VGYFGSGDSIAISKNRGRRNTVEIMPESTSTAPASECTAAPPRAF